MKNKKKTVRSLILIMSLFTIFTMFISNNEIFSNKEISYREIYISAGDTLWSLATEESKNNSYYSNKDLRYIIKDIKKINNLENSELNIGQKIFLPYI